MYRALAPVVVSRPPSDPAGALLEARSDTRVAVDLPLRIFSGDFSGALRGTARDLSVGGICVATTSRICVKSIRRVQLDLASGPMDLAAEGRWQSETSDDCALTGVRFLDPNKNDTLRLFGIVHDASREVGQFLFDRSDLAELCADQVTSLADCSRYRHIAARRRIFREEECKPGDDSIFLVMRGEVSLSARLGTRRDVLLERLKPGNLFGGLPAVADLPNQESATADVACVLLEISRQSYSYMRLAKPLLAQRLAQIITRGQLRRSKKLVELAIVEK